MEHPLISYCVKCYNQEHYIEQALKSAFAQTYEPLEIVIGDDASSDRSNEIILRMIDEYRKSDGRHTIVYFHNEHNLGNMGNWQKIVEKSHGELLVKADGDDWSEPDRVERLVAAWLENGKRVHCVYSDCWAVDMRGKKLWSIDLSHGGIGAVEAYSRACYSDFPPLDPTLVGEEYDDAVYSERARILCSERIHIPKKLVYYRQGSGVSSIGVPYTKMLVNSAKASIVCARQLLQDVEAKSSQLDQTRKIALRQKFEEWIDKYTIQYNLCTGKWLSMRYAAYCKASEKHILPTIVSIFMLLPPKIRNKPIDMVFCLYRYVKQYCKRERIHE